MLEAFKFGFSTGRRQWKIAAIVYFFQLCLALTLGLQVLTVFESSIGNSLEINKLLHNYDHTVITDFLKTHGASVTPLIGQLRWLVVFYLIFSVFIDAGLLVCARAKNLATAQTFWQGAATYFFPFLKMAGIFLVFAAVWTGFVFAPIGLALQPALDSFSSEIPVVWSIVAGLVIYFLGLSCLFLWSISSRFWKIKTGDSIHSSIKNGWKFFRKNKSRLFGLLGLFFVLQCVLVLFYWLLEAFFGMTSPFLIVFMALIQQIFAFFRVQIRQMLYLGIEKLS
jgi:hypothetical protein